MIFWIVGLIIALVVCYYLFSCRSKQEEKVETFNLDFNISF
jgi:hypothetical protein